MPPSFCSSAPVVLKHPPRTVRLFGMELADVTPELQAAYNLDRPTGVLILDPVRTIFDSTSAA